MADQSSVQSDYEKAVYLEKKEKKDKKEKKEKDDQGPEQGEILHEEEGKEGKTRHDDKTLDLMKEFKGKLRFQVLKNRAPKKGDTGGFDADEEVVISHLQNPYLAIDYED